MALCVVNPVSSGSDGVPSEPGDARNATAISSAFAVAVVIGGMSAAFVCTPECTGVASSGVVVSTSVATTPIVRSGVEPGDVSV